MNTIELQHWYFGTLKKLCKWFAVSFGIPLAIYMLSTSAFLAFYRIAGFEPTIILIATGIMLYGIRR